MRILVTGKNGQLGRSINKLINTEVKADNNLSSSKFIFVGREELDLSSEGSISHYFDSNDRFDVIINCAAYTAVDKAEEEQELANQINHLAVKQLASIANKQQARLIHISTDYVFDGENFKPYCEDDTTNPNGIYGITKLDGEKAMQEINPLNSIIIRTSWVYSSVGANFVKTMLRLGKERDSLGVIFDQVGTPTYVRDLAKAILDILVNIKNEKVEIYNYSNEGVLSWYDFAKEIMRMAKIDCSINPIETSEYPTPAKRPHFSLLNKSKIKKEFNLTIPFWKDSLNECLKVMGERK
jgi:dTDP-4-dehydrorhamnose reductase